MKLGVAESYAAQHNNTHAPNRTEFTVGSEWLFAAGDGQRYAVRILDRDSSLKVFGGAIAIPSSAAISPNSNRKPRLNLHLTTPSQQGKK